MPQGSRQATYELCITSSPSSMSRQRDRIKCRFKGEWSPLIIIWNPGTSVSLQIFIVFTGANQGNPKEKNWEYLPHWLLLNAARYERLERAQWSRHGVAGSARPEWKWLGTWKTWQYPPNIPWSIQSRGKFSFCPSYWRVQAARLANEHRHVSSLQMQCAAAIRLSPYPQETLSIQFCSLLLKTSNSHLNILPTWLQ